MEILSKVSPQNGIYNHWYHTSRPKDLSHHGGQRHRVLPKRDAAVHLEVTLLKELDDLGSVVPVVLVVAVVVVVNEGVRQILDFVVWVRIYHNQLCAVNID